MDRSPFIGLGLVQVAALAAMSSSGYVIDYARPEPRRRNQRQFAKPHEYKSYTTPPKPLSKRAKRRARGKARSNAS